MESRRLQSPRTARPVDARRFDGRTVIVTGAGSGIGRATARRFAAEGADVLCLGRARERLEQTVALCEQDGGSAWAHGMDVRRAADIDDAVERALARWDRIDVLINNAGAFDVTPFLEIAAERWDDVIATNLTGVFLMSQRVARSMRETGGGAILHNISIDASGADGPLASYNASKAALLGLNRTMAVELAQHGIRVNGVSPGHTYVERSDETFTPEVLAYLEGSFERVPMRRLVRADEVAAAFAFLASDDASAITGHNLTVDCGLTADWYVLETLPTER